jgi:hypothetical protein
MDDTSPLRALLGTVDRTLVDQGVDPTVVTEDDKILIATQYVETAGVRERMAITTLMEDHPCARLLRTTS